MEFNSLFKNMAAVIAVSIFSAISMAQANGAPGTTGATAPPAYPPYYQRTAEDRAYDDKAYERQQCDNFASKVAEARSQFHSSCRKSGISPAECSKRQDICEDFMSEESSMMDFMSIIQSGGMGGSETPTCGELTSEDLRSRRREAKEDKRSAERSVNDRKRDQLDSQRNYQRDSQRIKEEMTEDSERAQQDEQRYRENKRELEAQARKTEQELKAQYQDLENQIRKLQTEKLQATINRKMQITQYQTQIDSCRAEAEKFYQEQYGSAARQRLQGSINALVRNGGTPKEAAMRKFKSCVDAVIEARNGAAEIFKETMNTIDMTIAQLEEQKADIKKNQELIVQQTEQAKQEADQQNAQAKINAYNRQLQKLQSLQSLDQSFQQEQQNMALAIQQATSDMYMASNSLSAFEKSKPRTPETEKMFDSMESFTENHALCVQACSTSAGKCGDGPNSSTPNSTPRPPAPATATGVGG